MNYMNQNTSSTAGSIHLDRTSPSVIGNRMIFEHGHLARVRQGISQATPGTRPALAAPVRLLHRDVSTRFGERLKELRTERNLTQVRMAREFGVDRSYISDLERGRKSISLPTMEIFALGLKLSLAELLTGI